MIEAMRNHPESEDVAGSACSVLSLLALTGKNTQRRRV